MYIQGADSTIRLIPPGEIYDKEDEATDNANVIANDEVKRAYDQYLQAQQKRRDVLAGHSPNEPLPPGAKSALEQEAFALWIYETAVKKY